MTPMLAAEIQASTKMGASVLIWATAGGVAVFLGLVLEKFAEWLNENFLEKSYHPHKTIGEVGWVILMIGIGIEVVVAGGTAIDDWTTKRIAIENSPINQPISDISAVVKIKLAGTNFVQLPNWGAHWTASLTLCDVKDAKSGDNIMGATGIDGGRMTADTIDVREVDYAEMIRREDAHGYILHFNDSSQYGQFVPFVPVMRTTPQKVKYIID